MLQPGDSYDAVYGDFRWDIPARYNIGVDICDKWAGRGDRLALIHETAQGAVETYSFDRLKSLSDRFAGALRRLGVGRGDRVAILLAQGPETAVVHIAAYKLGAVVMPLFTLFGPDALEHRLADSGAKAIVGDAENLAKVTPLLDRLPALEILISTDGGDGAAAHDYGDLIERAPEHLVAVDTAAEDPAMIVYTSGTTGPPKGALHAHRVLLGHLPGIQTHHENFPQAGDLCWTPADWAWIGGLLNVVFPAWHFGVPVLAHRMAKFDAARAFELIARHRVRNCFLPPTALKLMRQVENPVPVSLRSVGSGGESLGAELLAWGEDALGLTINEFYGQTEANLILSNRAGLMPVKAGSMGRPVPGHVVAVVDEDGVALGPGEVGQVAVRRPDPVMFLNYWNDAPATAAKFIGDWCLTGDLAHIDTDGYFWFVGRNDDVITSAGYRIGPAEIEDCLMKHPAVAMAAAVGVPDEMRTEIVKAFIVLAPGVAGSPELARQIQEHVKSQLAAHEYPRAVEFVAELPLTATGKIMRRVLRDRETTP
ncbi:MAG: acyl-CoA synthetase [Proteobacteria bacterium]|nr:acyl-CoA synthetase [Pseudomonadota bacterium]